ncbi:MAG: SDR family NAD(P)-dependent oxidoreductase [Coxiellaceae bacterium]|nr:SDR family NAD(P)-dependent oxidoreductase [Coxiellaceae bacterium]
MSTLKGKVAIVTGSTSGIGAGIARMLSNLGVNVVINSVSSVEKGEKIASELTGAIYVQGNIGIENDCKAIVTRTIEKFGRIDILVNNAGKVIGASKQPLDISNHDFSETLNLNVVGTWCLIRESLPHLKSTGDGNIINITACTGIDPAQAVSGIQYAVAKAAINQLTKFIAKHCGPEVRANAIAPGLVMTERASLFPDIVEEFCKKIPLKRVGSPEDIAELVVATIRSNYINGEVIMADGGFSTI